MSSQLPTSGLVISVSSEQELAAAFDELSNISGGGEIWIESGVTDFKVSLWGSGGEPVVIRSADADDPAVLNQISLREIENVTFANLTVSSDNAWLNEWRDDLNVRNSSNITFRDMAFEGVSEGFYDPNQAGSVRAADMGLIRSSTDISFVDNHVSGYFNGLALLELQGVQISGNTFTELQGDGLRMGGVQDVEVTQNHFHDFHGTLLDVTHMDMIQLWSSNAKTVSARITISDNILDSGTGVATQSIFMRNELMQQHGNDPAYLYEDITITNNLIYNGHLNGIRLSDARGVEIADNTLLWNTDAGMYADRFPDGISDAPQILVARIEDGSISGNISGVQLLDDSAVQPANNLTLNYASPQSDFYVSRYLVNADQGSAVRATDIVLRADSPVQNVGSDLTQAIEATSTGVEPRVTQLPDPEDSSKVLFDASHTVDETGRVDPADYTFTWTFSDGTVAEGISVMHTFAQSGDQSAQLVISDGTEDVATTVQFVSIADNDFLYLDFEAGLIDLTSNDTSMTLNGAQIVETDTGRAIQIGGADHFGTGRQNDHYHDLDSFSLSMDITVEAGDSGRLVQLPGAMFAGVSRDGSLTFHVYTDEGTFKLNSGARAVNDGAQHTIAVGYSNSDGEAVLEIDGVVVDTVVASGTTAPQSSHGLVFGSSWSATAVNAVLDNIYFGRAADHTPSEQALDIELALILHEEDFSPSDLTREIAPFSQEALNDDSAITEPALVGFDAEVRQGWELFEGS